MNGLQKTTGIVTVLVFAVAAAVAAQSAATASYGAQVTEEASFFLWQSKSDRRWIFRWETAATISPFGGAVDFNVEYRFPKWLSLLGGAEYCYTPTQGPKSLSLAAARAGARVLPPITSFLSVYANVTGRLLFCDVQ